MPNVMSPEAILANQQNAQKSTGPRTPAGKARASRNALKYGLLAETIVVNSPCSCEDQADFDSLLTDFVNDHQPRGLTEETLVERLAVAYWKLRRVQQYETASIRDVLEAPDPIDDEIEELRTELAKAREAKPDDLKLMEADFADALTEQALRRERNPWLNCLPKKKRFRKIVRYETMLERKFNRALAELYRYRDRKARESAAAQEELSYSNGERVSVPSFFTGGPNVNASKSEEPKTQVSYPNRV